MINFKVLKERRKLTTLVILFALIIGFAGFSACGEAENNSDSPESEAVVKENQAAEEDKSDDKSDNTADEKSDDEAEEAENQENQENKEDQNEEDEAPSDKADKADKADELPETDKLDGGYASLGVTQEPDYLDPHLAISAGTKELLFNVYEGLFKMNIKGGFDKCLIEDYDLSDDQLEMTVTIKADVKFHDGSTLDADDVVFSIERAAGRHEINAWNTAMPNISAEKIDDSTVKLTMQEVDPHLLATLTAPIVKKGSENLNEEANGTGPFILSEYLPQDRMILKRFDDYHGEKAYLEGVNVMILADADAATYDLAGGLIDIFPYLPAEKVTELEENYNFVRGSANMVQLLAFNNDDEVLSDPDVRKAINSAIDRANVIDIIGDGYGSALYSGLSPALGEYYNDALSQDGLIDIEEAKAIIAEKYPDGLKINCKVPGNYVIHVNTGEVIATQLKAINVEMEIERIDWMAWLDDVYKNRDYQTTIIALTFDEYTPRCVLERYASDANNNFINFKNAEYDKLLNTALTTSNDQERIDAYKEMQSILFADSASAFLQDPDSVTAVRKVLGGYVQYPAYVQDLSLVYFIDEEARNASGDR